MTQHHAGLRHRSFDSIDQQKAAVGHPKHALDLAAEIRMTRRVDNVELHPLVADGCGLGEDRDALLTLEIIGVQNQLADLLVGGEDARLLEQRIDQRGLAVVDVGDDCHIAQVGAAWRGVVEASHTLYSSRPRMRRSLACGNDGRSGRCRPGPVPAPRRW